MRERESDIKSVLTRISKEYSDGLRASSRKKILEATLPRRSSRQAGSFAWGPAFSRPLAIAGMAALLFVLALPALLLERGGDRLPRPIGDLQVATQDGHVVLTWSDGGGAHRVVRATNRDDRARVGEIPGEMVMGERWVDRSSDESEIVYYVVE